MAGVNKVILVGRVGKDPEIRNTAGGTPVASFSIATSETWNRNGQKEEKTEWHNIILWNKLAELAGKYVTKGKQLYIEGKLQTRSWDDKNTGAKRYTTEVVGTSMTFLDSGNAQNSGQPNNSYSNNANNAQMNNSTNNYPYKNVQSNTAPASFDNNNSFSQPMDNSFSVNDLPDSASFPSDDDIPF